MTERLTVERARAMLAQAQGSEILTLFLHGSLQVELYQPHGVDRQQPHSRDEIYVIVSGTGIFVREADRTPFEPGEVIFVPAGAEHHFEDFSADFSTWVFFFGPSGGEQPGV